MSASFRPCAVVPVYDHEDAVARTVAGLPQGLPVILVDDGSGPACAEVLDALAARRPECRLIRRSRNGGKGAAMRDGIAAARASGYTHAIQIDADGQHETAAVVRFLDEARAHPEAVICGVASYGADAPLGRRIGRWITHVWVWVHTLSLQIRDSMCGLRVYPVAITDEVFASEHVGERMEFDTEILVRLYWRGVPIRNLPVRVHYPPGGVSHFRMLHDNLRISAMHTRLFLGMLRRLPRLVAARLRDAISARVRPRTDRS